MYVIVHNFQKLRTHRDSHGLGAGSGMRRKISLRPAMSPRAPNENRELNPAPVRSFAIRVGTWDVLGSIIIRPEAADRIRRSAANS